MHFASVTLKALKGTFAGRAFVSDAPAHCLIGRAHDCQIRLPAEDEQREVSRHHCLLEIATSRTI